MFNKQGLVKEMSENLKKEINIDPSDKKWIDGGGVDMLNAFSGAAEKRLITRIESVIEASKQAIVYTENVEKIRIIQGEVIAMQMILATINNWRLYAKQKGE